jgi:hypothetical protein
VPGKPLRNPDTVVNHLFQGLLRSQIKCQRCQHESNTYDPFMDLSLEIKGCASLKEALQHFTQVGRGGGLLRGLLGPRAQQLSAWHQVALQPQGSWRPAG